MSLEFVVNLFTVVVVVVVRGNTREIMLCLLSVLLFAGGGGWLFYDELNPIRSMGLNRREGCSTPPRKT